MYVWMSFFTFTAKFSYLIASTRESFDSILSDQVTPRDINFQNILWIYRKFVFKTQQ